MNEYRILVVDDEEDLCEILKFNLENEGYEVDTANSAEDALKMDISTYDLLLLDVMMGEISGFKMASMLKKEKKTAKIPIIFITAKDTENDTVTGFNIGADDYITKPFNLLELIARVKSNLRRYMNLGNFSNESLQQDILKSGGLELNTSTKEVKVDGLIVKVTPIEYRILELLLRNKGRVFSIDEIYEKVWKEESFNVENTVAVHIRRIREKIEINPKEPRYLKVVWGIGYKIEKI